MISVVIGRLFDAPASRGTAADEAPAVSRSFWRGLMLGLALVLPFWLGIAALIWWFLVA